MVGGLKGEVSPKWDWEGAYNYNRADQTYFTHNAINGAGLNSSLAGILTDANGNPLPSYDIFALQGFNGTNAQNTIQTIKTTLYNSGVSELWSVDGHVHGRPFDLPAGPVDFVVGSSYTFESLSLSVDGLTQLGLVPGLSQAFPFSGGTRDRAAVFIETRIPIFSETKNIAGFYSLEVTAAGRYEWIWPGGDTGVPKVGVRWQPFDKDSKLSTLTLRGGYSEGFIAPSIYNLFGPDFISNPTLVLPDGSGQVQTQTRSNPNLAPSESQNWNAGFVYSPKVIPGLTVSVDYYNVRANNIVIADPVSAVQSLNALGSASPWAPGFTFDTGARLTTTATNQVLVGNFGNLLLTNTASAAIKTDGFDLSASYARPLENWGKLTLFGNANVTMNYEVQAASGKPFYHYEGLTTWQFGTAQGTIPDYRINVGLTWEIHDFTYTVLAHYIPPVTDLGFLHPQIGDVSQGFTITGQAWHVPAYYTLDMQLAYYFGPKYGRFLNGLRLAVGCNNITDEDPPLIASAIEDNTDKQTYDIMGRFIYFEISKSF
jgi:iron complex outermembrane receptor protein